MFNMDEYLPWQIRLHGAIRLAVLGHLPLWLATIKTKSKIRYITAAALAPTMVGIFFLWWTFHLVTAIIALGFMSWLMFRVVTGKYQ